MRKRCYLILLLVLNIVIAKAVLYDVNSPSQSITNEVDRSNMFGLQEQPRICDNIIRCDSGVTPQIVAELCGRLGVKSFRLGMNLSWVLEFNNAGVLTYKDENIQKFKSFEALLRQNGVQNIMLTNTAYMYPYGYSRSYWTVVPKLGSELYVKFLKQIEQSYKMIAEVFPDVTYFEVGNELNAPRGINLCKEGYIGGATEEQNAQFLFTTSEQSQIAADICYYANRGIKSVNPNGKVVTPGPYMGNKIELKAYLNTFYEHIKSGYLPTCKLDSGVREIPYSVTPSDYFEYLNWHPYIQGAYTEDWLAMNDSLYQIAIDHDDAGRKILITEFGYYDSYLDRREKLIADVCVPAITALTDRLKNIEAVYIFKMFNSTTSSSMTEQTYGIFDSPLQSLGMRPKPIALSLLYHYNGADANPDSLYKYMKSHSCPEIQPSNNGYINEGTPSTSLVQNVWGMQIKSSPGFTRYGYLEFPLSNIDYASKKIDFKIFLAGPKTPAPNTTDNIDGSGLKLSINAVDYTFDNTLTWNNKTIPTTTNEVLVGEIPLTNANKDNWISIDVTSIAKKKKALGESSIRFRLASENSSLMLQFRQMRLNNGIWESGAYYPRLVQDSTIGMQVMRSQVISSLDNQYTQDLIVYPTISNNQITINGVNVQVFDIYGRLVLNKKIVDNTLKISGLKNGIYIVKTEAGLGRFIKR